MLARDFQRCSKGNDDGFTINSLSGLSKRRCRFCLCSWNRVAPKRLALCFHFADETQFERSKIFRNTIQRFCMFQLKVELVNQLEKVVNK